MNAQTIQLMMMFACVLGLYFSRIHVRDSRKREYRDAESTTLEARRARDTTHGLHAFIGEAQEILDLARDPRAEDPAVGQLLDDYHTRLVLFLMRNMSSYFARQIHHHDGLRSFTRAYPATISAERLRMIRHLETDILRLTSFLALLDRPLAAHEHDHDQNGESEEEEPVMHRYGGNAAA